MKAVVSLDEFRKNFSEIVDRIIFDNQTVVVQNHNKPGVIMLSEQEYENLKDPRRRFSSKRDWDKLFIFTNKVRDRMSSQDQKELEQILTKK